METANTACKMHAFQCIAQPIAILLDCILYVMHARTIWAYFQALKMSSVSEIQSIRLLSIANVCWEMQQFDQACLRLN